MSRPLRVDVAGGIYHVMSRGIDRHSIFEVDWDRIHFLELLATAQERFRLLIYAYVLMDNHFHLIVDTPDANLSRAVQWIKVSYSMWFNAKHRRVGPLFQGRFKSELIDPEESWLVDLSLYIHQNPVRVKAFGLSKPQQKAEAQGWIKPSMEETTRRLAVLRNYRWSSYSYYVGFREGIPDWLSVGEVLSRLGERENKSVYLKMAERKIAHGHEELFLNQLKNRLALGRGSFVNQVKELFKELDRDQAGHCELRERYSWNDVVTVVEQISGKSWDELQRRGEWGRYLAYWGAQKYAGMTLKGISEVCLMKDYGAVNMGIRRFLKRSEMDAVIRGAMREMDKVFKVQT